MSASDPKQTRVWASRGRLEHQKPGSRRHQSKAADHTSRLGAEGRYFLQQDKARDGGDPQQIHYPADEEQHHEDPTTTDTKETVQEPHPKGAADAGPPMSGDEGEG